MAARDEAPLRSFAFGSCQERKLFPIHCAPNRLGNDLSLQGAPHLALAAMTIMLLLPFCMMYRRDLRVKRDTLLRQGLLHGFCTVLRSISRTEPGVKCTLLAEPPSTPPQRGSGPSLLQPTPTQVLGAFAHDTTRES
ncbi:hypothetical protein J4Q44_G00216340 [Coregonus suidteri]|uniref:Uncharacterized protein n=1 Tax=Coregonus suidteri TaxID=861788 RepID=A0AAN8LDR8_9TELE